MLSDSVPYRVILPSQDAADVWDEPLSGVESQNPYTMVTLQPQLIKTKDR